MVNKNMNFGNAVDITIAEFGTGDILIGTGSANNVGFCSFKNQEVHPIGWVNEEQLGSDMREANVDFLMAFTKVESLDVLIEELISLRAKL